MLRPSLQSPKSHKVFLFGMKGVGKTAVLRQSIYGKTSKLVLPKHFENTIEDTYTALVETDKGNKEKIHFFETPGIESSAINPEALSCLVRNYILYSDGIVLVYAINNRESFSIVEQIKRVIDRCKEKKEIPVVCLGNKVDKFRERKVEMEEVHHWSQKERVKSFEVSATERKTLIEPLVYLASKLNVPQNKSAFPQLSRKVKGNANITLEL